MREFVVDVSTVASWEDFIAAFNSGFIHLVGGEWNGNLNAFNDYLYWPEDSHYRLVISGWQICHGAVKDRMASDGRLVLDVIKEILDAATDAEVVYS